MPVDASLEGKRIHIEFEGAFLHAKVYFNGEYLGEHKGGYTGFTFDVTEHVNFGGDNVVAVRLDAEWNPQIAPRTGDYIFIGGIYRDGLPRRHQPRARALVRHLREHALRRPAHRHHLLAAQELRPSPGPHGHRSPQRLGPTAEGLRGHPRGRRRRHDRAHAQPGQQLGGRGTDPRICPDRHADQPAVLVARQPLPLQGADRSQRRRPTRRHLPDPAGRALVPSNVRGRLLAQRQTGEAAWVQRASGARRLGLRRSQRRLLPRHAFGARRRLELHPRLALPQGPRADPSLRRTRLAGDAGKRLLGPRRLPRPDRLTARRLPRLRPLCGERQATAA